MPGSRLALVACKDSYEGQWSLAKGNETGIRIVHLVDGERVRLDMRIGEVETSEFFGVPGSFPLPLKRIEQYRVAKVESQGSPTTVEIMLNGTAPS